MGEVRESLLHGQALLEVVGLDVHPQVPQVEHVQELQRVTLA